jgi:ribosomal protein L44E
MKKPEEMRPGNRYGRAAGKPRTLRDLAVAKVALVAVCRRCRHQKLLFPYGLAERLGADFPIDRLAPRLRCTECRALGRVTVHESVRD